MAYTRQYTDGVGWENEPSINTPISAENLNQMDEAIQDVDAAVYTEFAAVYAAIAQAGGGKPFADYITSIGSNAPILNTVKNRWGYATFQEGEFLFLYCNIDAHYDSGWSGAWRISAGGVIDVGSIIDARSNNLDDNDFKEDIPAGSILVLAHYPTQYTAWGLYAIIPASGGSGAISYYSDATETVDDGNIYTDRSIFHGNTPSVGDMLFLRVDVDAHKTSGVLDPWYVVYGTAQSSVGDDQIYDCRSAFATIAFWQDIAAGSTLIMSYDGYVWDLRAVIPASGGGTTVVANPSGTATATLGKLQVGSTIYEIPTIDQAWAGKVTAVSGGNITPNNASFPVDPFTASNFVVLDIGVDAVMPGSVTKWSLQYTVDGNTVTKGISDGRNGNAYDPNFDDNLVAGTTMILQKVGNNFSCLAVLDGGGGASALSDLTDTAISTPSDGQFLKYDATSAKWINASGGGASSLADLSDTTISSPTAAQPLTYDATNSVWKNGGIIPAANGGTGNNSGYVRAGQKANTTIGANATAEGYSTTASGTYSHAEGASTTASGMRAHAEGYATVASADCSHASGNGTVAGYANQFVCGKLNSNKSTSIFEVGIGVNASSRRNGLELDTSGNLKVAGDITDGDGNSLSSLAAQLGYLEQTVTLSTSASTTVTFTDSSITANSFIEYACSQWDLVPESITGAAGSCTIVLPKVDSAQSVTVRIYVR